MSERQNINIDSLIALEVMQLVEKLRPRCKNMDEINHVVYSVAVNAVMLLIATRKLHTGDSTRKSRKNVLKLINNSLVELDQEGDREITWHDGEARA